MPNIKSILRLIVLCGTGALTIYAVERGTDDLKNIILILQMAITGITLTLVSNQKKPDKIQKVTLVEKTSLAQ